MATDTIGKQVTAPSVAISNDVKAEQVLADSLAKINHKVQAVSYTHLTGFVSTTGSGTTTGSTTTGVGSTTEIGGYVFIIWLIV